MTIDPLTLFLRLFVVVERKLENEIANYCNYELTPYPMLLLKDGKMSPTKKYALKTFLLKNVKETYLTKSTRIIDGGALFWCCNWKRKETFEEICDKYSNFYSYHSVDIIVFDLHAPSTKDATYRNRSGTFSETVEIENNNPCKSDRSTFFYNYINKANFVNCLVEKLQKNGFNVTQCPMDADTTIVKTALTVAKDSPVDAFANDILSLLIHHMTNSSTDIYKIYIANVKKEQRRECYNVADILNALENHVIKYLLFVHPLTGCNTMSAIDNFGKTSIFKKLKDSVALTNIGDVF